MWDSLRALDNDCTYNFRRYDRAAIRALRSHRKLGIVVVVVTTIVGTSVFGALIQNNPNFYVQIATGPSSLLCHSSVDLLLQRIQD